MRRPWVRYAAAAVVIIGIGAYLWSIQTKEKPVVADTQDPHSIQSDLAPGDNKAELILADGNTIVLDSVANGPVAREHGAAIVKTGAGKIVYEKTQGVSSSISPVSMNTMRTPRGGQYELSLPDGTNVWLNAESSITYPTMFAGKERKVSITGEVYFEVIKNARMLFKVSAGSAELEVLGTSFNVNAYADEPHIKISLVEGSVEVQGKILKPGEAYYNNQVVTTDIEKDVAWKKGLFAFENADIMEVMRQLSRWYDVSVSYEENLPDRRFNGKIERQLPLSQVLKRLSATKINYRIEQGDRIVIMP